MSGPSATSPAPSLGWYSGTGSVDTSGVAANSTAGEIDSVYQFANSDIPYVIAAGVVIIVATVLLLRRRK